MYKIIAVATDLSPASQPAVDEALRLARGDGARLHLIHVYNLPIVPFVDSSLVPPTQYITDVMQESEKRLAELREKIAQYGVETTTELRTGPHVSEILEGAKNAEAELLVIGTHGRTGIRRVAMGSVAEQIVRYSHIPVLVVRSQAS